MRRLIPVQVECYAGAKADEAPRRFVWDGRPVEVGEVLDRWYQVESRPEWPRADYFKVRGTDDRAYLLKHEVVLRTLRPGARIVLGNGVGASGLTIAVIAHLARGWAIISSRLRIVVVPVALGPLMFGVGWSLLLDDPMPVQHSVMHSGPR
jgi:hypothetical protein